MEYDVADKIQNKNTAWNSQKVWTKNVFNADESGLFYRLLPDKTLQFKGEKCHGGKKRQGKSNTYDFCKHGRDWKTVSFSYKQIKSVSNELNLCL